MDYNQDSTRQAAGETRHNRFLDNLDWMDFAHRDYSWDYFEDSDSFLLSLLAFIAKEFMNSQIV